MRGLARGPDHRGLVTGCGAEHRATDPGPDLVALALPHRRRRALREIDEPRIAALLEGHRGPVSGHDGFGDLRVSQVLLDTVARRQSRRPPVADLLPGEEVPPGRARPHHCQDSGHGGHSHPPTTPPPTTRAGLRSDRRSRRVLRTRLAVESGSGKVGDTGGCRHHRSGGTTGPRRPRAERNLSWAGGVLLPTDQSRRLRDDRHRGRGR